MCLVLHQERTQMLDIEASSMLSRRVELELGLRCKFDCNCGCGQANLSQLSQRDNPRSNLATPEAYMCM